MDDLFRRILRDLETDCLSPLALLNGARHLLQQVRRIFLLEFHIRVSCDPIAGAAQDLLIGEELIQEQGDHVFQQNKCPAVLAQRDEPVQNGRHLNSGEDRITILFFDLQSDIQTAVEDQWEGAAGIDCHRRHDREDLLIEIILEDVKVFTARLVPADHPDALLLQRRDERLIVDLILIFDHGMGTDCDALHLLFRRKAGRVWLVDIAVDRVLQRTDSDHKEFVQVGRSDRKEFTALQQRIFRIHRFVKHALVEFQPAQFPADQIFRFIIHFTDHDHLLPSFCRRSCGSRPNTSKKNAV